MNLGIYEREQADLAIATDLVNVKFSINEYNHTYNYNKRRLAIDDDQPLSSEDSLMDKFWVQAKNKFTGKYKDLTYIREVYSSFLAYSLEQNVKNKLVMTAEYRVVLKNQSSLKNYAKIRNYYDENFNIVNIKINGIEQNVNNGKNINGNGVKIYEMGDDIEVQGDSNVEITLIYNIDYIDKTTGKINQAILSQDGWKVQKHTSEIVSYSTYNKDGSKYASIDKDSAPGNSEYGNFSTYEDDIDASPDFIIKKATDGNGDIVKMFTGTVFEDKASGGTTSVGNGTVSIAPNEYIGNGILEDGEKRVKGAKVELLDKNGNVAELYILDDDGEMKKSKASTSTDGDGKYFFKGLIPGIYYLKYTYGTGQDVKTKIEGIPVTPQDYKSTIVTDDEVETLLKNQTNLPNESNPDESAYWKYPNDENSIKRNPDGVGYWYEKDKYSQYSASIDNYARRLNINKELSDIGFELKNDYDNGNKDEWLYIMNAQTPIMCVAIEDKDGDEIDAHHSYNENTFGHKFKYNYETVFGIVERPRQNFNVTKEINHVKVVLANGQILLEGNPLENGNISNYLTYPNGGRLKIEMDSEILQGATLNVRYVIKVYNLSDINYNTMGYYNFGTDKEKIVKTKIRLIDYMDKELAYLENDGWDNVEINAINGLDLSDDTKNLDNYNYILQNESMKELSPGEISNAIEIKASKLLSTSKDMNYDNKVEFYNVQNDVGRFYDGTPGNNGDPNAETEPDHNRETFRAEILIIPPTGQARIYYAIGISCLVLLVGGIILIKKKVLD